MAGSTPARDERAAPLTRIVAGGTVGLLVAVTAGWWTVRLATELPRALTSSGPADPADAVLRILAVAALAVGTWLAGTTALAYLVELPALAGSRLSRTVYNWTPRLARRIVGATLGGALLGIGGTTSALADPTPPPTPTVATTVQSPGAGSPIGAPDPSFVPLDAPSSPTSSPTTAVRTDAPSATSAPAPTPTASPTSGPTTSPAAPRAGSGPSVPDPGVLGHRPSRGGADLPGTVTVHRGDTLWGIAAAHLGPHASEAEIAREWPRWYAANRAVIGDDPDLILAGQVLVVPPPVDHPQERR